jgi:hypothetical protein
MPAGTGEAPGGYRVGNKQRRAVIGHDVLAVGRA